MPSSYRTLRRSRSERMLGGVCGGFAQYFGIDPVAARVAYVLGTLLTGGALVLAYAVFWMVMPEERVTA